LPTKPDPVLLLDTSAAIALTDPDHPLHAAVRTAVRGRRLGLAGHANFEFYSVVTRLPAPRRRTPDQVRQVMASAFPEPRFLDPAAQAACLQDWPTAGLAGGQVWDALVAAAARAHGLPLVSCDRRAEPVYRAVGADLILVDPPVGPESG